MIRALDPWEAAGLLGFALACIGIAFRRLRRPQSDTRAERLCRRLGHDMTGYVVGEPVCRRCGEENY